MSDRNQSGDYNQYWPQKNYRTPTKNNSLQNDKNENELEDEIDSKSHETMMSQEMADAKKGRIGAVRKLRLGCKQKLNGIY